MWVPDNDQPLLPSRCVLHLMQSYHLGGMGCSNGVVGINLVADLLKVG